MRTFLIRVLALSSIAAPCILGFQPIVHPAEAAPPPGLTLVWFDEFDHVDAAGNPTLDTSKWGYLLLANPDPSCDPAAGFGKFDEGCNVKDAVSLDGQGHLVITTWTDQNRKCSGHPPDNPAMSPHQTGMIATGDDINSQTGQPYPHLCPSLDQRVAKYGYVEARIMFTGQQPGLTDEQRVWSSYWFQSPSYGHPLNDPRQAGTEIDVVEHRSASPDAPSALHWDAYCQGQDPNPNDPLAKSAGNANHSGNGSLSSGFHTYGLEWTPEVQRYYYDCKLVWTVTNSPQLDPKSQIGCPWSLLQPYSTGFPGPVSRAGEYIILDNEVRLPVDPVTKLPLPVDYGAKGDPKNAIMTVDYVRWYEDRIPPAPVQNLSVVSPYGMTSMAVSWTAPGDDGTGETCTKYDLRYSTSPITASNFNSATFVTSTPPPSSAGFPECQVITGLTACTTYYFAIKTMDEAGNWSGISNVRSAITECDINRTATCPSVTPDNVAPGNIFVTTSAGNASMALTWTAPGDDGTSGTASEYDLRFSPTSITAANFDSTARATITAPHAAGSQECRVVTGLCTGTLYYFAIKTKDERDHWSGISNVTTGITKSSGSVAKCGRGTLQVQSGPSDDADAPPDSPGSLSFSKPYPNPARGSTRFQIDVPGSIQGAKLRIDVFDVAGRRVRSLVDQTASQGQSQIEWNLLDSSGRRVASGLYMIRVGVGDTRKTFPVLVLR